MLGFFRRIIHSKFGVLIGLVLLGVIALSFAAGDIKNLMQGNIGGGGSKVATVGDASIGNDLLENRIKRVLDNNRRENPALSMGQFLDAGALTGVLDQLIDGLALTEFARKNDMRISKKLVDAEIAAIPAFQDATGKFSQSQYQQLLAQQHIPEADLREDITGQIVQRMLLGPAGAGARTPQGMVLPYSSMLLEKRAGTIAVLPALAFLPSTKPDDATLTRYYAAQGERFALPEQRRVRYALIDSSRFAAQSAPNEAEIAQYFKANAPQYAASEKRAVHQLILPTQNAAKDIASKISPALTLEKAATQAGLSATQLAPMTRQALAAQTSDAAAGQIFTATRGALVGPVKTGLGWALYSVSDIQSIGAKSIDSARPEIVKTLTETKTRQALADFSSKIDGQIGNGATFDEVVKSNGLTAAETPALTAQGRNVAQPQAQPDPALAPILTAGFGMEQDDDPQVVAVPDQKAALVALAQVIPAGPPALAQVRADVERAYLLSQGAVKAKAAADALRKKVSGGTAIAAAVAGVGVALPPVERLGAQRSQLGSQNGQVPAPLIALFSMTKGSTRILTLPNDQGYAVLHLDDIQAGDAGKNQQLLGATAQGLRSVLSDEYGRQFVAAIRVDVGVKRNDAALARVNAELRKGGAAQ
ncbi:MAG TPA: SurA N-terminal domain-containing protein [Sphingobium sp.]|uniref:peptidylprolyl isomerase n=1 Tax=Sphingobium sp. TaxID=1912891 RepID=UPI002ECFD587